MPKPDNYMDDLFRQAGENYPLHIGKGNWDALAPMLSSVSTKTSFTTAKNWKKSTRLLFVTALITAFLFFDVLFTSTKKYVKPAVEANYQISNAKLYGDAVITQPEQLKTRSKETSIIIKQIKPANRSYKSNTGNVTLSVSNKQVHEVDFASKEEVSVQPQSDNVVNSNNPISEKMSDQSIIPGSGIDSLNTSAILFESEPPVVKNKHHNVPPVYLQLVAGFAYSEVKNQAFTRPGVEAGIRLGFNLTANWAIETGLMYTQKFYYSSGKYFNMKNTDPAMQQMELLSIKGVSNVLQLPLKAMYRYPVNKKEAIFTSVGVSSYFFTKEKNNYQVFLNGATQNITVIYKEPRRYVAAVLDISAGYQYKMKNRKLLRIEPFMQIPIKGIGIGRMPVTSAGLHVGYQIF